MIPQNAHAIMHWMEQKYRGDLNAFGCCIK